MKNSRYKFRAFVDGNMQYDVSFIEQPDGKIILVSPNGYNIVSQNGDVAIVETEFIFSNPILMQYTGRNDENGKEIYEGDIIVFGAQYGSKNEVRWIARNAGFLVKDKFGDWQWLYDVTASTCCKVIGNVYQHPELLNQAKG